MINVLRFTKMEGLGNDYVYICTINQKISNPSELSKKISDRHFGIGSDGLILISESKIADFKMNIYNADGSEAEMCGNGIRCAGKFVYDKGYTDKTELTFETLAGVKKLVLFLDDDKVSFVSVDMGEPILNGNEIPVINYKEENMNGISFASVNIPSFGKFTTISMGNPHAIMFVKSFDEKSVSKVGSLIENFDNFPNKTNVEFIKVISRNEIDMRVWERGSGETLACGTGACASAVACFLNGYTDRKVFVNLLGGKLEIDYDLDNHVYMKGPARTVFEGEIDLN